MSKKYALIGGAVGLLSLIAITPALADTISSATTTPSHLAGSHKGAHQSGVFGTVASISGNIITLTSKGKTSATYSVDATNAKILKAPTAAPAAGTKPAPTTITVANIAVGDTLMVQGAVSGTNVTATSIFDGVMKFNGPRMGHQGVANKVNGTAGKVTAVSGSSFTVTAMTHPTKATATTPAVPASTVSITVNTSGTTTFKKDNAAASLADVTVGQFVLVAGTRSDNTVTATNVRIMTTTGLRTMFSKFRGHKKPTATTTPATTTS